jgi:hypothetical protein
MKINYTKSDLIYVNLSEEEIQIYFRTLCCKLGDFSIKYLGVPLHHEKLKREDIQPVVDKTITRIPGCQGRLLSYAARLTLLKVCLANIPINLLYIMKFPKWAIVAINSQMSNFFWDDSERKHRYHLSNWPSLAQRKEAGGVGVPDLRDLNLCLLASWIHRYRVSNPRLWKDIVDHKYQTSSPNILCCDDRHSFPFLNGIIWAAQAAMVGYAWKVSNERKNRF